MCGIAGKLYFDSSRNVDRALLERMHVILAHRGPDDAGLYCDGPIGLANRRLSILDLSSAGHQPMSNRDGSLWITYNGEVYNFRELRRLLERDGVAFRSHSDTEVILALYERFGPDCLQYLRGMFALGVWDRRHHTLFLARDRLGKKPLYYYQDARMLVFASEPKAILQDPDVPVAADLGAIDHYLTFGYVPSPFSAFRGLRKLPPAHWALVRDGKVGIERYWRLRYGATPPPSEAELSEELLTRLREAVELRMISDVPLGAFLSGGIDSSTIVALMSDASSAPVKTFSIGFEEDEYNELPYARQVAERYQTEHHEFIVKPNVAEVLPDLVWHYGEPYADSSAIPTYYLAKMTREHVTVALNGDGGDENFAGYERYLAVQLASRLDWLPGGLRRGLAQVAQVAPGGHWRTRYGRLKRFLTAVAHEPQQRYARWVTLFTDPVKAELYTPDFRAATAASGSRELLDRVYEAIEAPDFVAATLGVDVATYLADDLLVKVDIASMASSLEVRSPLLDHPLVEFAASIPSSLKLKRRTSKYILKRAVADLLPASVIDRRKMGFGVPIDRWFRHELRELAHDTLLSRRCLDRGLFRAAVVERLLNDHVQGRAEWHPQLWSLLFLELWFQQAIDAGASAAPRGSR